MELLIITGIFLILPVALLIFPLNVIVDSERDQMIINMPVIAGIRLCWKDLHPMLRFRIFFIIITKDLLKIKPSTGKEKKKKGKKKKAGSFGIKQVRKMTNMTPALIKTISLKKIMWNIDTGDYPLNAQLIPIAQLVNSDNIHVSINFNNTNNFYMHLQTRLILIAYTIIKYMLFKSKNR